MSLIRLGEYSRHHRYLTTLIHLGIAEVIVGQRVEEYVAATSWYQEESLLLTILMH